MVANKLLAKVKKFEEKNKINVKLDQNFLIDQKIIDDFINICHFKKNERVIEIGTGLGFLTEKIAQLCQELISIEIDFKFKPYLKDLPKNVKIIFDDGYKLFCNKKFILSIGKIDKIVGNFPYSKIENFLHPLMKGDWFFGNIFLIGPASFVNTVNQNPIFNSYYQAFFIKKIKKNSFYPMPNTTSAIIFLKRVDHPKKTGNLQIFIKRFLYEHEDWKLKNCLREGIIEAGKELKKKLITKNQAREIIKRMEISQHELEKKVANISLNLYHFIGEKIML